MRNTIEGLKALVVAGFKNAYVLEVNDDRFKGEVVSIGPHVMDLGLFTLAEEMHGLYIWEGVAHVEDGKNYGCEPIDCDVQYDGELRRLTEEELKTFNGGEKIFS